MHRPRGAETELLKHTHAYNGNKAVGSLDLSPAQILIWI